MTSARRQPSRPRSVRRLAVWLLLVPVLMFLFPGLFARQTPRLGAFPFFIWYQFAAAAAAALATGVVFLLRDRREDE